MIVRYEERLCNAYSEIIAKIAEDRTAQLSKQIIRQLQSYKRDSDMMQSPPDCALDNLWDEICVQVQTELSSYWEAYEDFIYRLCFQHLDEKCSETDLQILWLQTNAFEDWSNCEFCDEDELHEYFGPDGFPSDYCTEDVVEYLCHRVIAQAGDYSNKRIERYLEQGEDFM